MFTYLIQYVYHTTQSLISEPYRWNIAISQLADYVSIKCIILAAEYHARAQRVSGSDYAVILARSYNMTFINYSA